MKKKIILLISLAYSRNIVILVKLNNLVHGTVHEPTEFFLAFPNFCLCPNALQFGRGTGGKNPDQRTVIRCFRQWSAIQHGQVTKDLAIDVKKGHTYEAYGIQRLQSGSSGLCKILLVRTESKGLFCWTHLASQNLRLSGQSRS